MSQSNDNNNGPVRTVMGMGGQRKPAAEREPDAMAGKKASVSGEIDDAIAATMAPTSPPRTRTKPESKNIAIDSTMLASMPSAPLSSTKTTVELTPMAAAAAAAASMAAAEPVKLDPNATAVLTGSSPAATPTPTAKPAKPADPNATAVLTGPGKAAEAAEAAGAAADHDSGGLASTLPPTMAPGVTASGGAQTKRDGKAAMASAYDAFVGQEMCGYKITRKLAEGGMGVVFEGEHAKIGRKGAIKVLKLELCTSDEVVERFHQEARAVNEIRHENIVDIYDFGRDADGRAFFVMEYLEGEPLSSRIKRGALKWSEAFPILEQTLRALKAAHDKGFVHRDLKPDNIWLKKTDGPTPEVKLLDFGIAKLIGADSPKEKLTQTGSIMGTPHYMSPEQINGSKDIDARTDIYAMGVITYELFAGKTPFVGDTLQAIMTGHLFTEPPRLANIPKDLGVPAPIAEIIDRMLVKDAADRYPSVADVLSDLRDVNKSRQPARAELLAKERSGKKTISQRKTTGGYDPEADADDAPVSKRPIGLIVGITVAACAVGGGVLYWKSRAQKQEREAQAQELAKATPAPTPAPVAPKPVAPPAPVDKPIDYDQVRKDAQTELRASLKEAEPAVRVLGADAIGKIKDQPSVPTLTDLTQNDPDLETRGHAADALGVIGVQSTAATMTKLEQSAPPPLKVWYASALARLGDKGAKKRLLGYAGDKDLKVSFKAALALADVSQPGDQDTIKALRVLAGHEAELNDIAPYAGAVILTKMAALHDAQARKILYSILEAKDEGSRLAAAEGLAKLGDDGGKKVLEDVLANEASPNRLVAAVAMIPLGDYAGYDFITTKLGDKDADTRRLAARGLGEIGERKSVKALVTLSDDSAWPVKIAAAGALMAIVGLDPEVLAQASVDWTKGALASEDWAVRKAAAGTLGDIPEKDAVPLLAAAIADPDPNVRVAAATSARKMHGDAAANSVAAAAKTEKDPKVKEEQVKALGAIGNPVVHDTLVAMQAEPGRVGVFAAGSLIAVGDTAGKAKLDTAVAAPQTDIRLAAVQSASQAKNPIVVPTLKTGAGDKVFDVRFTAAEGLAGFHAEQATAVPVLKDGLDSKDPSVQGRAESALLSLGEQLGSNAPSPEDMINSPDAKVRLAAVPAISELPPDKAAPLLRRVVADPDADVRRAGVDAIAKVVPKDKDAAIKLYKPLVTDADPVVRSKSEGQLSRLVDPPPKAASAAPPAPTAPPVDDSLPKVKAASDDTASAGSDAAAAKTSVDTSMQELTAAVAVPAKDDAAIKHVTELATQIDADAKKSEDAAGRAEASANVAASAAGVPPSADAQPMIAAAQAAAKDARTAATAARATATAADKKARDYARAETEDPTMFVAQADAAIATGDYGGAKRDLDRAVKAGHGVRPAGIDFSYAQLYDKMAARQTDPAQKLALLKQAQAAYEQFAKSGSGPRVQRANDRAAEIADDIKELGAQ